MRTHSCQPVMVSCGILVLLMASFGQARDLYVAPAGNDSAPGDASHPWLSLQKAADSVAPGDTVHVAPGSYAGFNLVRSGTEAKPIAFLAASGVKITRDEPTHQCGINLEGPSYVIIEGFEVCGRTRAGIRVAASESAMNRRVTVRNNHCDQNGSWGIITGFNDDLLIENNVCSRSQREHGIYVGNSGDRPVIRNNVCWGNAGCGIHMNGDKNMGGDGIISHALVERNTIYDNGRKGGSGINCDGVQDSTFRDNLLYDNHASGISLFRIDGAEGSRNNTVVNNTIVQAADGRWALNIGPDSTGTKALNNILWHEGQRKGSICLPNDNLAGFASDHNIVTDRFTVDGGETVLSLEQWKTRSKQDSHSFIAAPAQLFVDPAQGDYHLKARSPAKGAGVPVTIPGELSHPAEKTNDIGVRHFTEPVKSTTPASSAPAKPGS